MVEPNCVLNSNYDLLEESGEESLPNDSSDDSENESDEYIPQNQPLISKLADWAINDNVPNSTFSDLLKILKNEHKCFNSFPTDARTIYKNCSGVSYTGPVDVLTVPPGIYYHFGISNM